MNIKMQHWLDPSATRISFVYLGIIIFLAIVLGGQGLFDDEVISLQGDMARYLMNGAFLFDVVLDLPLNNFFEYAAQYYSRYPALSLGHHPPLTSVAEVPFYAVFGISVFSGKLSILCFFILANVMWFKYIKMVFDEHLAFFSTLLLVTTPYLVEFSRVVMSEIPALALLITSLYYFQKYLDHEKIKHLILMVVYLALSVYARQTTIVLALVFAGYFVFCKGMKKVFIKEILWSGCAFCLAIIPIGILTVGLSPSNIHYITSSPSEALFTQDTALYYARVIGTHHLTPPVLILSVIGMVVGLWKRDRRFYFFVAWIMTLYLFLTYAGTQVPRYTLFWIPVFCAGAASLVNVFSSRPWKIGMATLVLCIAGSQFVIASNLNPSYARGYKEAAHYIVENKKGEAVLYSSDVDTGYFIFHTRGHDSYRNMIVLRADKLFATRFMYYLVEDRIKERKDIYKPLNEFGVCHVVIEDTPSHARSIEWLREEVKSEKFILRKTIPIITNDRRLNGVALKIYEYKSCGHPNFNATIEMNLPIVRRSLKVRFGDLFDGLSSN